jgi:hypothetical protein
MSALFPSLYVPESGKTRDWCKQMLMAISQYGLSTQALRTEREKDHRNYAMMRGEIDQNEFKYLTNQYGVVAPARMVHYPIINRKVETLVGEWLGQPMSYGAFISNREGKLRKLDKKVEMAAEILTRDYRKEVESMMGISLAQEELAGQLPEDIERMLEMSGRDGLEEVAYHGLRYLQYKHMLQEVFRKGLYDLCTSCKEFYCVDVWDGDPQVRRVDPRSLIYNVDLDATDLQDLPWVGEERLMTPNEIITEFRHFLKDDDLKTIKELADKGVGDLLKADRSLGDYYVTDDHGQLRIRVVQGQWYSMRPSKVKVSENKYDPDQPFYKILPEDYKPKKSDQIETIEFEDLWEGVMIGHEVFIKCRRKPNQPRREEWGYSKTRNSYVGAIKSPVDGMTMSIVDTLYNVSLMYDIVNFHIDLTLSRAGNKAVVYDLAQKPKQYSFAQVVGFAKNAGIVAIDTARDHGQRSAFNQFQQVDFGLSSQITQLINLKQELERTADSLSISRFREGEMNSSDGAFTTQQALLQSAAMTQPLMTTHYRTMETVLNRLADLIRYAWKPGDKLSYIMDDNLVQFFEVTDDIYNDEVGIFMQVGSIEKIRKDTIMRMAEAALATKTLDFEHVLDIEDAETASESRRVFKQAMKVVKRQQAEMQQQAAQIEQAKVQNDQAKAQIPLEIQKLKSETEITIADMQVSGAKDTAQIEAELKRDLIDVQGKQKLDETILQEGNATSSQEAAPGSSGAAGKKDGKK